MSDDDAVANDDAVEDGLAKQLAEIHEAMLEGRDVSQSQQSGQLGSGVDVLRLIEQVRSNENASLPSPDSGSERIQLQQSAPPLLGRYEIVRLLGEGSHGLVYLAIDLQLDREVALKVPRVEVLVS